jgi:hypothetical protein
LGIFKKKNQEKKSPSAPRKESKKEMKKSQEDLADAGKKAWKLNYNLTELLNVFTST